MFSLLTYPDTATEIPGFVVAILFFTPLLGGLIWYFYNRRFNHLWKAGIFPKKYKFTEDHLLEAYLSLASRLIQLQKIRNREKIIFVNSYFNRHFPKSNYDFSDSLAFNFRHPIQPTSVAEWIKSHLLDHVQRSHVIYFLVGITMVDGHISKTELAFLALINQLLELDETHLSRILAMYTAYQEEGKKHSTEKQVGISTHRLEQCAKILGVPVNADATEIKKAHRKMVKIHHPDRFQQSTSDQQAIAEEKFKQIQRAYEDLMKAQKANSTTA